MSGQEYDLNNLDKPDSSSQEKLAAEVEAIHDRLARLTEKVDSFSLLLDRLVLGHIAGKQLESSEATSQISKRSHSGPSTRSLLSRKPSICDGVACEDGEFGRLWVYLLFVVGATAIMLLHLVRRKVSTSGDVPCTFGGLKGVTAVGALLWSSCSHVRFRENLLVAHSLGASFPTNFPCISS